MIVASAVTNQPPDQQHLVPMLDRVIANCGQAPGVLSADTGYFSRENSEAAAKCGVDAYIAVGRHPDKAAPGRRPSPAQRAREVMAAKLVTIDGKAIYARRKAIVEPVFGLIKQARGFRSFSLRSLAKVRAEWDFVCATHNLLKLFRYGPWSLGAQLHG